MRLLRFGVPFALSMTIMACGDGSPKTTGASEGSPGTSSAAATGSGIPAGLTLTAAAQLDSGNVAFRLKQYAQATVYYERAAQSVPNHPAPWYGVYMVAMAQQNTRLADSAMAMVGARSGGGELLQDGVSLQHGQSGGQATRGGEAGSTASGVSRAALPGAMTSATHPVLGARR